MALSTKNANKLAKAIKTQFNVTTTAAKRAIDEQWMMLACAPDVASWRNITLSQCSDVRVSVITGDRLIATLRFDEGVLPKTELTKAWEEVDAYLADNPISLPPIEDEKLIGTVIAADLSSLDDRCVEVKIQPSDGTPIRTMVLVPFLNEGRDLLAYVVEQLNLEATILFNKVANSTSDVPRVFSLDTDICEMIFPLRHRLALAA